MSTQNSFIIKHTVNWMKNKLVRSSLKMKDLHWFSRLKSKVHLIPVCFHWLARGYINNVPSLHISPYFFLSGWSDVCGCCFWILHYQLVLGLLSFRPTMSSLLSQNDKTIINKSLFQTAAIWINFLTQYWLYSLFSWIWYESKRLWKKNPTGYCHYFLLKITDKILEIKSTVQSNIQEMSYWSCAVKKLQMVPISQWNKIVLVVTWYGLAFCKAL